MGNFLSGKVKVPTPAPTRASAPTTAPAAAPTKSSPTSESKSNHINDHDDHGTLPVTQDADLYVPKKAQELRKLANEEFEKQNKCYEESKAAYENKNGAQAKQLSEQGKEHNKKMNEFNEEAVKLIFEANNSKHDADTIDLHGLFVKEALQKVEERIEEQKRNGRDHLVIIVGAGNHSPNHVQKIKPAAVELLQKHHVSLTPDKPNHGCIYVEFGKENSSSETNKQINDSNCIVM